MLLLHHPKVAGRDCGHCLKYLYDEKTGKVTEWPPRSGKPRPRPGTLAPCQSTPSQCPKGTPEDKSDISDKNWLAYVHYLECKAVGRFPDDAIVKRNARIIRQIEDDTTRVQQIELFSAMRGV